MIQESFVPSAKLAVIGAVLLALAGCGRVGPLDLPPGTTVDQGPKARQMAGPDATPGAPQGQKKDLPIDWLLK